MKVETGVVGMANGVVPIPTRIYYDALSDPYAVRFEFIEPGTKKVVWTFGRDLLIEGLKLPTGLGDVKVRPEFDAVWILISAPGGSCNFRYNRSDIQDFVNRMTYLVPRDKEHELVNWDEEMKVFEE